MGSPENLFSFPVLTHSCQCCTEIARCNGYRDGLVSVGASPLVQQDSEQSLRFLEASHVLPNHREIIHRFQSARMPLPSCAPRYFDRILELLLSTAEIS
jgi:hypothetical protein